MRSVIAALVLLASAAAVSAVPQEPSAPGPASPGASPTPAAAQPPAAPPAPAVYSYDPQGRRDPFVSLLTRGTDPRTGGRPAGLQGVLIGEVIVKGVLHDRTGFVAMVQGPDAKTYIVRSGEKLMDGSVKAITADSVVFSQDVNDPLSTIRHKEVRKTVRPDGRG